MIMVNKEEANAIRKEHPDLKVTRTMRQHSSRHRYYAPETDGVKKTLSRMRNQSQI